VGDYKNKQVRVFHRRQQVGHGNDVGGQLYAWQVLGVLVPGVDDVCQVSILHPPARRDEVS
jgi:hypothetical protein